MGHSNREDSIENWVGKEVRSNVLQKNTSTINKSIWLWDFCFVLFSVLPKSFDYRIYVLSMKDSL